MNLLNLKLQRRNTIVCDFIDTLNAFLQKLESWKQKAEKENFAMFVILLLIEGNLDVNIFFEILRHLVNLRKEFLTDFSKISDVDLRLVRKPFAIPIEKVTDGLQDELIEFRNDSACKDMFETLSICKFWARMCTISYPRIGKECIKVLLPFSITYLCEAGFCSSVQIKTKAQNRIDVEDGIRCELSLTLIKIYVLVSNI